MKSEGWRFGPFVLMPAEHTLLRNGDPVRLARKGFDLLVLVERAGLLVRKEELLERLWPNAFVEEGNLAKHVSTLRKALGEVGDAERFIETVPKVGVRFVSAVTPIENGEPAPAVARRRAGWQRAAAIAVMLAAVVALAATLLFGRKPAEATPHEWKALAVLPFTSLDGAPEPVAHLGIGLTDGIITRLSGQRLLPVRPTSLVKTYTGGPAPDVKTVGVKLGADVVLEGHLQRAGDVVRVTVQLSDVERAAPIWGETFDQPMAELFRLEDAIAERVAGALRLAAANDPEGAKREIDAVLRRTYRDHHVAYSLGTAYAQLGDASSAVQWLRTAAQTGFPCAIWYARDPLLDPLRRNAEFGAFVGELEARHTAAATKYREQ